MNLEKISELETKIEKLEERIKIAEKRTSPKPICCEITREMIRAMGDASWMNQEQRSYVKLFLETSFYYDFRLCEDCDKKLTEKKDKWVEEAPVSG